MSTNKVEQPEFCDTNGIVKALAKMPVGKIDKELVIGRDIKGFEKHLRDRNLSKNTILSFSKGVEHFFKSFTKMNKVNLLAHKSYLIESYAPKSFNMHITGLNAYIKFWHEKTEDAKCLRLILKTVKIQQKSFLENVISLQQYKQLCEFLKKKIKEVDDGIIQAFDLTARKDGVHKTIRKYKVSYEKAYFIVRCLGLTGVRIGELVKFNTQAVEMGYFDVYGKGGKVRRIYIPKKLQDELLDWIEKRKLNGFLFVNQDKKAMTERHIAHMLKEYASLSGIDRKVVYPHSFRHMYAKAFLAKRCDIALLSDLLGHSNIETTRIYLRLTSAEQKEIVDKIVAW